MAKSAKERFDAKWRPVGECWEWTAQHRQKGFPYGKFWYEGKVQMAHRVSWLMAHPGEPIPANHYVLHSCDNPSCVNPAHLFLGTPKDNTQDMIAKGRDIAARESRRGENSNFAKLTESDVRLIRWIKAPQSVVAESFGISQSAVSMIRSGDNWRHI